MIWIVILACIISVTAILTIAVAPGKMTPEAAVTAQLLSGRNYAHRGLYTLDQSIPENSLAAFKAAREKGYGVELDVHLTADNQAVVFHDYDLLRTCRTARLIKSINYDELSSFRLFGSNEKIPLLSEVLDVLEDTPVVVEIKPAAGRNALTCAVVLQILKEHRSNFCVQSFDPRICAWLKKNTPHVLRGQLSCPPREYTGISVISSFALGNLLFNFLSRPHYIAYKYGRYTLLAKLCMLMKPLKAVWTVSPDDDIEKAERGNDIIIFEHYKPRPVYR